MTDNNIIERLKKYCNDNPEMVKNNIIKGINPSDSKVVVQVNGETKNITIDELESNVWLNPQVQTPVQTVKEEPIEQIKDEEVIETMEEPIESLQEQPVNVQPTVSQAQTLKDIMNLVNVKDEVSLNKALETFAIDDKTGTININKAIKIITDNSTNNVVNAVKSNVVLPSDLSNYDVKGNVISGVTPAQTMDLQKLIDESFNNILVYVEAAKLKNIVYNEAQIQNAKMKYATGVHDKLNVLGLNKESQSENTEVQSEEKIPVKDLRPDNSIKKAGFADILILTIIVLVYAAIIINLVTKLK